MCTLFIFFWANVFDDFCCMALDNILQNYWLASQDERVTRSHSCSQGLYCGTSFLSSPGMLTGVPGWGVRPSHWGCEECAAGGFVLCCVGPWLAAGNNDRDRRQTKHRLFSSFLPAPPHPLWLLKGVREKGLRCRKYFAFPYKLCCDTAFLLGCWEQRACLAQGEGWHQKNFT